MKLHLPTVLLATVLACISQPVIATETINLNTHNWDQYIGDYGNPGYPRFDNVNLINSMILLGAHQIMVPIL